MRLNWGKTFVLGFGFLAISAVWPLYDAYMPAFLEPLMNNALGGTRWAMFASTAVGLIMGIDNFLGLTLQPWIGARSDRTRSRWGRRRPYLLVGMPVAAVALLALYFTNSAGLVLLLLTTGVLNLAMSIFRSPTVALMPDLTPAPLRSKANGVINFMGGIGAAIVVQAGAMLFPINHGLPFVVAALIMIIVFLLFVFIIREPEETEIEPAVSEEETPQSLLAALRHIVFVQRDKNALKLFFAIFAWSVAYQAVNSWFTLYSVERFGVKLNEAAGALLFFILALILGALPAGYIGTWFGRRRTISAGLIGMVVCFAAMHFVPDFGAMKILLAVAGLCWALININSYPMVVELCHPSQTGTYTGLYYIFTGVGGTIAPSLAGFMFGFTGSKNMLFLFSVLFMILAIWLILGTKKGEAERQVAA